MPEARRQVTYRCGSLASHTDLLHTEVGVVMDGGNNTYGDYSLLFVSPCQNVDVSITLQQS